MIAAIRFRNLRALVGGFAIAAALGGCSGEERPGVFTQVGGVITSDANWGPAGNPYVLTDDVTVSEGVTLTLSPGVVVKADSISRELIVLGTLVAKGTAQQPIILTSYKDDTAHGDTNRDGSSTQPSFGDWVGVGFAASSPGGIGDFVEIRYAGYYGTSGTNFSQDASSVDARVRTACMRCHLFPDPQILPRELWRDQIVTMQELSNSLPLEFGGSLIGFSLRETVEWYEAQAPEVYALPRSLTQKGSAPIRFHKRDLSLGPEGIPAIATVERLEAGQFGGRGFVLSAVDMLNGSVYLISRSEGPLRIGSAGTPVRAVPGDLNGDGLTDLVVSDLGVLVLSDELAGRVVVALQSPDGSFAFEPILEGVGRVADARPLDVDLDGDLDVVVASFGWRRSGGVYLLRNETVADGPLDFRKETIVSRAGAVSVVPIPARQPNMGPGFAVAFAQQYEIVSAFYPVSAQSNGNAGATDNAEKASATGNDEKAMGDVARGSGYEEHVLYRAPHPNWGMSNLEPVDLDGDSDIDFLLAHGDTLDDGFAFKPYQGVMWLENRGGGEYEAHRIGTLYGAHRAEAVDFDGDGDLDVVAAGFLPQVPQPFPKDHMRVDSIIWFERAGEEWIPWSVEVNHPWHTGLTVLDLNSDGRPDIIAPVNSAWEVKDQQGGSEM
ncbi:MAG: VCBS repeat-containing protein, partial [Myxococcales bacterium]|nr:VCBS repeat-containing protein [Myxococcales bacterium]